MLQRSMLHVSVSGSGQYCSSTSYERMVRMYMYTLYVQHTTTITPTCTVYIYYVYILVTVYCIITV